MGKIFYLMGKSASGKDRLSAALRAKFGDALRPVVMYTTRPIRSGETDGVSYYFIDEARFSEFQAAGRVIESRLYHTVHGPWIYATLDDGQIDLKAHSYLITGTLESYLSTREYYGKDKVVPLYVDVEDGLRLYRALQRERSQKEPKYAEMCRRFLADSEDFSAEKVAAADLPRIYVNDRFDRCLAELTAAVREEIP